MNYQSLKHYFDEGLLQSNSGGDELEIVCYTRKTFLEGAWDEVTKTHRGVLYHRETKVNHPLPKLFNIGEMPETEEANVQELMDLHEYEVYDKSNGHLFILSSYTDPMVGSCFLSPYDKEQHVVFSTKGSLPHPNNPLLNEDIRVFGEKFAANSDKLLNLPFAKNMTLMFEAIVEHDKHTLYEQQAELYGENTFVLLCGYAKNPGGEWESFDYESLCILANVINCPVVKKYDEPPEGSPTDWKSHKNIEGYVIHFPMLDFRVKVKTDEYWKIRFKKDLTPERIVNMFAQGGNERLVSKLPEEVDDAIIEIVNKYFRKWYFDAYVKVDEIEAKHWHMSRKEIALDMNISDAKRTYMFGVISGKSADKVMYNKTARSKFLEYVSDNEEIIASMGQEFEAVI